MVFAVIKKISRPSGSRPGRFTGKSALGEKNEKYRLVNSRARDSWKSLLYVTKKKQHTNNSLSVEAFFYVFLVAFLLRKLFF